MNGRAWYNEIDPYVADWLRGLIAAGHIAPGDVDERSIADVRPDDLAGYTQCHFFAGVSGWSYALRLAGWADDRPVWTGSCPCQPFSAAGRQKGFDDSRHLWPYWARLIAIRRPAIVFGEQVASAAEWLRLVRGDLEALEYAVGTMPVEAASAGADHLRDRFWFVAHGLHERGQQIAGSPYGDESAHEGRPARHDHVIAGDGESDVAHGEVERRQNRNGGTLQGSAVGKRPQEQFERCGGGRDIADDGGLGDARGAGLALGSIAEDQRGNVREQGAPLGPAGDRSFYLPDAARDGCARLRIPEQWPGRGADPDGSHVRGTDSEFEWVIGADGKARRVKSGIRLLADGVPQRVAKLRALGNAIDPRPAAQFIAAAEEAIEGVRA